MSERDLRKWKNLRSSCGTACDPSFCVKTCRRLPLNRVTIARLIRCVLQSKCALSLISLSGETEETFDALVHSDAVSVDFWLKKFAGDAELVEGKKK